MVTDLNGLSRDAVPGAASAATSRSRAGQRAGEARRATASSACTCDGRWHRLTIQPGADPGATRSRRLDVSLLHGPPARPGAGHQRPAHATSASTSSAASAALAELEKRVD
ncbi:MAG: hypothetical protein MZW92_43320 [Comamonadaceae bacterium]|nr:hypothetical protein [Comamonadaceae bacterium]